MMQFNALIPELKVANFEKSLSFYCSVLGFRMEYQRPERQFAFLSYQACQLMIEQEHPRWKTGALEYPYGRGINFQILVSALDDLLQSLHAHGYPLFVEPEEHWYRQDQVLLGQREFLVMDPDGYLLRFAQAIGQKTLASLSEEA
jgi:catechol 2,3-dioxygenase-like lactoylglutathione lyase family enzyme